MTRIKRVYLYETSDGVRHPLSTAAKEVQARLDLAEALGSEEWEETLGMVKVTDLITFLEQNREVIWNFLSPKNVGIEP